jgi:CRP/FNR family cyclic AMP-dependent transcriptional regulator
MSRYVGDRLETAIREQKLVDGDRKLARQLLKIGTQIEIANREVVYREGSTTQGIFLILLGTIQLTQNGNVLRILHEGEDLGTLPLLFSDPRYTVTATAMTDALLFHLPERRFTQVSQKFPALWKNAAKIQGERLRHQNRLFLPKNNPVKIFIGSSLEGLSRAQRLATCLAKDRETVQVILWNKVFGNNQYPLEVFANKLNEWDFAAVIWTADDLTKSRLRTSPSPRDNLVFEAGLSIGRLGRERTFILIPGRTAGSGLKVPSDLKQAALMEYRKADMSDAAERIRTEIHPLGARTRLRSE